MASEQWLTFRCRCEHEFGLPGKITKKGKLTSVMNVTNFDVLFLDEFSNFGCLSAVQDAVVDTGRGMT